MSLNKETKNYHAIALSNKKIKKKFFYKMLHIYDYIFLLSLLKHWGDFIILSH